MLLIVEINRPHSGPYLRTIHGLQDFLSPSAVELRQLITRFLYSPMLNTCYYTTTIGNAQYNTLMALPLACLRLRSIPVNFVFLGLGLGLARVKNWAPPSFTSGDNFVFRYFLHNLRGALRLLYPLSCAYIYHNTIAWLQSYLDCVARGQLCQISLPFPRKSCLFKYEFACNYSINKL